MAWVMAGSIGVATLLVAGLFLASRSVERGVSETALVPAVYRNTEYQFSFVLPLSHTASAFSEDGGQTILIHGPQGDIIGQLYVSETSLSVPISPEFIRGDMKDVTLFDLRPVSLVAREQAVAGVAFSFEPASERKVSEIWFARSGVLYQWTIAVGSERVMGDIIHSLQ